MNAHIADSILDYLCNHPDMATNPNAGIPFISQKAGLVRTFHTRSTTGKPIRFPVSCTATESDVCGQDNEFYSELIPSSEQSGILYFEDRGVLLDEMSDRTSRKLLNFKSYLTLVSWLNLCKLGYESCHISECVFLHLLKYLPDCLTTSKGVQLRQIKIGQKTKDASVFKRYTYNEIAAPYLLNPYDYLAIELEIYWSISPNCLDDFVAQEPLECC